MREYELLIPEFIIAFAALAVLAVELSFPRIRKDFIAYFTAAWGVAVIVVSAFYVGNDADTFQGVIQVDDFTTTFRIIGTMRNQDGCQNDSSSVSPGASIFVRAQMSYASAPKRRARPSAPSDAPAHAVSASCSAGFAAVARPVILLLTAPYAM